MNLSFERQNDILIVNLMGELDHHSAEEVRNKIDDKLDEENIKKLIMNFSNVTFMDSSGIGAVIGRYKKLSLKKGNICIVNVRDSIKRVFELSGMFKIIKCYNSINEAVEKL